MTFLDLSANIPSKGCLHYVDKYSNQHIEPRQTFYSTFDIIDLLRFTLEVNIHFFSSNMSTYNQYPAGYDADMSF